MEDKTIAEKAESWAAVGEQLFVGARDAYLRSNTTNAGIDLFASVIGKLLGAAYIVMAPIGTGLAAAMANAEDQVAPAFASFAARGVNDIFGTSLSEAEFARLGGQGKSGRPGDELGRALMAQLRGGGNTLEPSDAAATKFVAAMGGMAIEDWLKGWMFEILSSLIPQLDIGKIEAYGALGDKVAGVLGLGGVSRRVLRPLVDTTIVTPFEWQLNKQYRPRLLTASEVARQIARGNWTKARGVEELARQGYSDQRIDALLHANRRYISNADVRTFLYFNHWDNAQAESYLTAQGWDEQGARDVLRVTGLTRNAEFEAAAAGQIVTAYAQRRIDDLTFRGLLAETVSSQFERTYHEEMGRLRRALDRRTLSVSEVRAAVRANILSVRDYRRALEADGYDDESVLVLELLLRAELDDRAEAAEHRARALAERAAERAERELAQRMRAEELERERAADRRGPVAALEAAAIRGLIPLSRVEEVYAADYDPDAVAILIRLLEQRRIAYVAGEEQRAAAEQRAARRGLSIGQYRAGVKAGALSMAEYQLALEVEGLSPGDVAILVRTLEAELLARRMADEKRRQAAELASRRRIDLGRFERLVRRGVRTTAQYEQLLAGLGFDEGSIVAMRELLDLQIADDTAARLARERADEQRAGRSVTPSQYLRAVVLGAKSLDQYAEFLAAEGFDTDGQIVLLAEARAAVEDAEAARRRRDQAPAVGGDRPLPLSTVRRAARLGIIAPATYAERLRLANYSDDDIAIDIELLLAEIAAIQDRRAAREAAEDARRDRPVPLAALARGVKVGTATMDQYAAALAAAGYAPAAANELLELLAAELAAVKDAEARRDEIAAELRARDINLDEWEAAVLERGAPFSWYAEQLASQGYGDDDIELLIGRLATLLEAAAE